VGAHEVNCARAVVRLRREGCRRDQGGIRRRHGAAVEAVVGQESVVQDVQRRDSTTSTLLHRQALEQLRLAAEQHEFATDWIAETAHAAALLEEVPEGVALDAIAGRFEEARVTRRWGRRHCRRGASRHPAHRVGDDDAIGFVGQCHALV
jgi:hypothetical protein